jgi:hypothetical protein
MIVKLKARNKPEKGGTRRSKGADAVPSSVRKPGSDMNLIWSSTIEENQSKKPKNDVRLGEHTTLHKPKFKNRLKNLKLSLIPTKSKRALEKFSDQQLYGYGMEDPIQNNPLDQFRRSRITRVNGDQLLTG